MAAGAAKRSTLAGMRRPVEADDLMRLLGEARRSALRLEQAPIYPVDAQAGALNDWLAGETDPFAGG